MCAPRSAARSSRPPPPEDTAEARAALQGLLGDRDRLQAELAAVATAAPPPKAAQTAGVALPKMVTLPLGAMAPPKTANSVGWANSGVLCGSENIMKT